MIRFRWRCFKFVCVHFVLAVSIVVGDPSSVSIVVDDPSSTPFTNYTDEERFETVRISVVETETPFDGASGNSTPYRDDGHGCECRPASKFDLMRCMCTGDSCEEIPNNLPAGLQHLELERCPIKRILNTSLSRYPLLQKLYMTKLESLQSVDARAFRRLEQLRTLSISDCRQLKEITGVLLETNPKLLTLTIKQNGLLRMPQLRMSSGSQQVVQIDLSDNQIRDVKKGNIENVSVRLLTLANNKLHTIEDHAFQFSEISYLNLRNNPLSNLSTKAFHNISGLTTLDVSQTQITSLPEGGLRTLEKLVVEQTHTLKKIPDALKFTSLKVAHFTYPYHCCFFKAKHVEIKPQPPGSPLQESLADLKLRYCQRKLPSTTTSTPQRVKRDLLKNFGAVRKQPNLTTTMKTAARSAEDQFFGNPVDDDVLLSNFCSFDDNRTLINEEFKRDIIRHYNAIECTPQPDALNPCEDIMGESVWLRIVIWFVWLLAILGNLGVLIVLHFRRNPNMRVHHFLMRNLAMADLCMGVYMAFLAIQDVETTSRYYNFAVEWQTGIACRIAGFLTVFSSELSIFTMFIISLDVWYNTRFAMKRRPLRIKYVVFLMLFGWAWSVGMAAIPLTGINSYSATSTCLPLQVITAADQAYVVFGLIVNFVLFVLICASYVSIYCLVVIRRPCENITPSLRAENVTLAKQMGVIIATNFLCWAPIIVFGLTAACGYPLISISNSKILLVTFYPLNSFANPFVYVFVQKYFKRDVNRLIGKPLQKFVQNRRNSCKLAGGTDDSCRRQSSGGLAGSVQRQRLTVSGSSTLQTYLKTPRTSATSLSQLTVRSTQLQHVDLVAICNNAAALSVKSAETLEAFYAAAPTNAVSAAPTVTASPNIAPETTEAAPSTNPSSPNFVRSIFGTLGWRNSNPFKKQLSDIPETSPSHSGGVTEYQQQQSLLPDEKHETVRQDVVELVITHSIERQDTVILDGTEGENGACHFGLDTSLDTDEQSDVSMTEDERKRASRFLLRQTSSTLSYPPNRYYELRRPSLGQKSERSIESGYYTSSPDSTAFGKSFHLPSPKTSSTGLSDRCSEGESAECRIPLLVRARGTGADSGTCETNV